MGYVKLVIHRSDSKVSNLFSVALLCNITFFNIQFISNDKHKGLKSKSNKGKRQMTLETSFLGLRGLHFVEFSYRV